MLPDAQDSIVGSVKHLSECDDESIFAFNDGLIFSGLKLVVTLEELGLAILFEDERNFGTGGEDEAEAALEEDALDDGNHLERVGREVEPRLYIREAVICEERIYTLDNQSQLG